MKRLQRLPRRVGILGGGQLARMLALKGHEMGLEVHVLSPSAQDPAAQVVRHHHLGQPMVESDLNAFFSHVDLVTFESEFMDAGLLQRVAVRTAVPIQPRPHVMASLQDRLEQKEWLVRHKIPTAAFRTIDNAKDAEQAYTHFQGQLVFKKRRFGYDGYGTYVVRRTRDLRRAIEAIEAAIGNKPDGANHGFIAEAFVPFKRELALMIARNASGATSIFPMVETHQQNARCLWVKGPLRDTRGGTALTKRFSAALDELRYEGILGVELFEAPQGLLVNELAPRVHNSAHYSLDALAEDQFTVHWKAVLNLTLSPSRMLSKGFAMYNLLGQHARKPSWALPPGVHLHWYGKQENRPGRKMGHITSLGSSANAALKIAQSARKEFDV